MQTNSDLVSGEIKPAAKMIPACGDPECNFCDLIPIAEDTKENVIGINN